MDVETLKYCRQLADDMSDSLGNLHRIDYVNALDLLIENDGEVPVREP